MENRFVTQLEKAIKENCENNAKMIVDYFNEINGIQKESKEERAMQVSYNGFVGELVKLERDFDFKRNGVVYNLEIRDREKVVTYSFDNVNLSGVKFLGGAVLFDN